MPLVSLCIAMLIVTNKSAVQAANSSSQLSLPSSVGSNISLTGGPHNWAGCTIINGVLQPDCLGNQPWNSLDWVPANGGVYASHSGIVHLGDCPTVNGHRSFVRIDYNDGSGYQISYEHVHNVDQQVAEGQNIPRGQYLGTISTDSNCGGGATGSHTHMSIWNFSGSFTFANNQAVDWNGVGIGAWVLDDGSPTQEQYTGCITPITGGSRLCPTATVNNDGSVAGLTTSNLLSNSSFETGSVSAWAGPPSFAAYNDSSHAMEGSYYAETQAANPNDSVFQDVGASLQVGQSYTYSIWVRSKDGSPIAIKLVLWGLWSNQISSSTSFVAGSGWTVASVGLPITQSGNNTLRAQLYIVTTGHYLDLDGAQLIPNLLTNASFETGSTSPWHGPAGFAAYPSSTAMEGSDYGEAQAANVNDSVYQDVGASLRVGDSYTYSIWVRSKDGTPISANLLLWGLWTNQISASTNFVAGPSWTPVSVGLPITQSGNNTLRAQIYITTTGHFLDLDGGQLVNAGLGNASFEVSSLPPWSVLGAGTNYAIYSNSSYALEGPGYLEMNVSQSMGSVYQDSAIVPQAGHSYTFTIWIKCANYCSPYQAASGSVAIWAMDGRSNPGGSTSFTVTRDSSWQRVSASVTTLSGSGPYQSLRVQVYLATTGVNLDFDGATIASGNRW